MSINGAGAFGQNYRILVVEDEPMLRMMVETILQGECYEVVTAGSGEEALEIWRQQQGKFDLMVTDMVLPDELSGSELAEQLQAERPGLKVVYASGFGLEHICAPGLELVEGWNFLQKPYGTQKLTKTIRQCLEYVPEEGTCLKIA